MTSKLRFYLRGLGIGVVVTALILMIMNLKSNNGEMSDAEIRARAAKLGMVDGNSFSLTDAAGNKTEDKVTQDAKDEQVSGPIKEEEHLIGVEIFDPASPEPVVPELEPVTPELTPETPELVKPDDLGASGDNKAEDKTEHEKTPEQEEKPAQTPAVNGQNVSLTVTSGNGSETVAAKAQAVGLVSDANDFNAYMCRNGYDRTIRVGTFSIPVGATYEEICKIIAS